MILRLLVIAAAIGMASVILLWTRGRTHLFRTPVISGALLVIVLMLGSDPTKLGFYEGSAIVAFFITIPIALVSGIVFLVSAIRAVMKFAQRNPGGTPHP